MKKGLRNSLGILIVLLTIGEFAYYLSHHSYLLKQLGHTPLIIMLWVFLLYVAIFGVLAMILVASLRMCRIAINTKDNLLLNAYSVLVNFFVIGQAGPGVRAAYLKKHHKLLVRKYIFVTLLYYAVYAVISTLLMLIGSHVVWWLTTLLVLLVAGFSVGVVYTYTHRTKTKSIGLDLTPSNLFYLLIATLLQTVLQIIIYSIELHSVNSHIALRQTVAYTGVANLALFVGLTPGAIGIRESFLVFTERLHHISSANIVSANIIDRSVYILFLGVLFVIVVSFHAKNRFSFKEAKQPDEPVENSL